MSQRDWANPKHFEFIQTPPSEFELFETASFHEPRNLWTAAARVPVPCPARHHGWSAAQHSGMVVQWQKGPQLSREGSTVTVAAAVGGLRT
jgi:hypothetical protein